jgi:hypothetical protein
MSSYPDKPFNFRETENRPGVTFDENDKRRFFSEDIQKIADEVKSLNSLSYRSLSALVNQTPFDESDLPIDVLSFDVVSDLISFEGSRLHITGAFGSSSSDDGIITLDFSFGGVSVGSFSFDALSTNIINPTIDIINVGGGFFLSYGNAYNNDNIIDNFFSVDSITLGDPNTEFKVNLDCTSADFNNILSFSIVDYWRVPEIIQF